MKSLITSLSLAGIVSASATANPEVDLYETLKDGTPSSPWKTTTGTTYTLSQDLTLNAGIRFSNEKHNGTVMDFSQGGHTLKVGGQVDVWGTPNSTIVFKGGVWDLSGYIFYGGGAWNNLDYSGVALTFDGAVISNASQIVGQSGYGQGYTWMARGAKFHANTYMIVRGANKDANRSAEDWSLFEFAEGSEIHAPYLFGNRDTDTPLDQNCTIRLTGAGTRAKIRSTFEPGRKSSGYHVEIVDGATVECGQWKIGNESANANSNTVLVADGGSLRAPGQEGLVGEKGSFNAVTVSNGTLSAKTVRLGTVVGSSNNVLRLAGATARLEMSSWNWRPFGPTMGHAVMIDDHANVGIRDGSQLDFCSSDAVPSIGNAFCVANGATFTTRYLYPAKAAGSTGNLVFVGADATLDLIDLNLSTNIGNAVVISNGTVRYSGDYGFFVGGDPATGKGNVCRVKGTRAKIRSTNDSDSKKFFSTFRNGALLEFDVSEFSEANAEPIFDVMNFGMNAGTTLSVVGVEAMQKRIGQATTLVLAQVPDGTKISIDADVLTAAQAALPPRCSLSVSSDGRQLRFRAKRLNVGALVIIR